MASEGYYSCFHLSEWLLCAESFAHKNLYINAFIFSIATSLLKLANNVLQYLNAHGNRHPLHVISDGCSI